MYDDTKIIRFAHSKYALFFICFAVISLSLVLTACGEQESKSNQKSETLSTADKKETGTSSSVSPQAFRDAALKGDLSTVKRAVDEGVEVNNSDQYKRTPLMLASFNGHTEVVQFLIEEGAQVSAKNAEDRTSLMFAASGAFPETVKLLLANGADPNVTDNVEGWTALMFAAAEGQVQVAQLLLDNGADATLKDKDGETAIDFANNNNHPKMVTLLKAAKN